MFNYSHWLRTILALIVLTMLPTFGVPRSTAATPDPQLQRYPYLQSMTSDSVVIVWTTAADLPSEVHYSSDTSFSLSTPATSIAQVQSSNKTIYQHEASVSGLSPATTYHYQIFSGGTNMLPGDPDLTFTTAPLADNRAFRFLVFGDSGTNSQSQWDVRDQMARDLPYDFMLHVGDIAYTNGTYSQFEANHFAVYKDIFKRVPIFPVPGNHEYNTANAAPYFAVHVLPTNTVPAADAEHYYSFDWGDSHFVAIDSNLSGTVTSKVFKDWLAADLATTTKTWKFVFLHHPAYTSGSHLADENVQALVPIFEQYHVDVVFNGHNHNYERTVPILANAPTTTAAGGIVYITSGVGGSFAYSCTDNWWTAFKLCLGGIKKDQEGGYTRVTLKDFQLTLEGVDNNGTVFDSYIINKGVSVQPTATPSATPVTTDTPSATPTATMTETPTPSRSPEPLPVDSYTLYLPVASQASFARQR